MKVVRLAGTDGTEITLYDLEPTPDRFCDDVARGLGQSPRKLHPKYFYDDRGARLFEQITTLPAYYPTRTEISILERYAGEIAERIGPRARIVEFGSGSGDKTRLLLRHLNDPAAYIPVDISRAQLVEFATSVAAEFPEVEVVPVCADYSQDLPLPPAANGGRCVAFFPGSTIGNFELDDAQAFLRRVRRLVGREGALLIGIDLIKDPEVLHLAYNDPGGVTAEFNLNLLDRINRECGADFDRSAFRHSAVFDPENARIEMRLVSTRAQVVRLRPETGNGAPIEVHFDAGEHILTEYSHKFDLPRFADLVGDSGWGIEEVWTDPNRWFAVVLLG